MKLMPMLKNCGLKSKRIFQQFLVIKMIKEFAKTRKRNKNGTFAIPLIHSGFNKKEYKKNYNKIHSKKRVKEAVEWGRKNKDRRKIIRKRWVKNNREKVNFLKRMYMYRRKQTIKGAGIYPSLERIKRLD